MSDQELGLSIAERERLQGAVAAAARYYRWELLRATDGWQLEYLRAHGAEPVLAYDSPWKVGYAPKTAANLIGRLVDEGFGHGTLARAGLMDWTEHGGAVDLHRDRLMLVARDLQSSAVGFVAIDPGGKVRSAGPANEIHRPSSVLIGVEEQRELLARGAVPVLVDGPMDAIAVSHASFRTGGEWAGIPLCGGGLSTAQVNILRESSTSRTVLLVQSGTEAERDQAAGYMQDLSRFFERVRGIALPLGQTLAGLAQKEFGGGRLNDLLRNSRPLMKYRASGRGYVALQSADLDSPAPAPGL
ncbi:hypothetical protein OHB24_21325 [Kribbella sp. NBC_00482]|uniref:hypothetical protein n=1 Tax=Kribbella sp. NBC_00482 TaxID=2975968 RepID=UPI002E18128D